MKRFLTVTAVLFLLLRPACDAWGAAHGHAEAGASAAAAVVDGDRNSTEFCCAKVQDSNLISQIAVSLAVLASDEWSTAPTAELRKGRAHQREARVGHPPDTPPLQLSYYARSARILR